MSNPNTAEEILNEIIPHNEYRLNGTGRLVHDDQHCPRCDFEDKFIKAMQEHTTQTLDRLKGEVEQIPQTEAGCGIVVSLESVLQLIEEVSDE